jgi:hypothetical protein
VTRKESAMRRFPHAGRVLALCFVVSLVFGCRKSETTTPAAPGAPAAGFAVKSIDLGSAVDASKKVTAPTTTFKPADTIYVSILSEGAAPSVTLATRWTYQDGQLVKEDSQTIAPSGPATTEFHISKPDGWPAGKYKVEVAANGNPAGAREFTVVD